MSFYKFCVAKPLEVQTLFSIVYGIAQHLSKSPELAEDISHLMVQCVSTFFLSPASEDRHHFYRKGRSCACTPADLLYVTTDFMAGELHFSILGSPWIGPEEFLKLADEIEQVAKRNAANYPPWVISMYIMILYALRAGVYFKHGDVEGALRSTSEVVRLLRLEKEDTPNIMNGIALLPVIIVRT